MTMTENAVRNAVDTATLFATVDAMKGDPKIAKFCFQATTTWASGTHNRSTTRAMQDLTHREPFTFDATTRPFCSVRQRSDTGRVRPTRAGHLLHRRHCQQSPLPAG